MGFSLSRSGNTALKMIMPYAGKEKSILLVGSKKARAGRKFLRNGLTSFAIIGLSVADNVGSPRETPTRPRGNPSMSRDNVALSRDIDLAPNDIVGCSRGNVLISRDFISVSRGTVAKPSGRAFGPRGEGNFPRGGLDRSSGAFTTSRSELDQPRGFASLPKTALNKILHRTHFSYRFI